MADQESLQVNILSNLERRQDRLEEVADRLTSISSDLSKMLAVHEQRLNQQERQLNSVETLTEKRREEYDEKLGIVFKKIDTLRNESNAQFESLTDKINEMEKQLWRYAGAFAVIAFILAYGPSIVKILHIQA